MVRHARRFFYCLLCFFAFSVCTPFYITAQTIDELQARIEEKNNQIKSLEIEINQYNTKVTEVSGQAKTLQNTLQVLDVSQKKVTTDLSVTGKKIDKTNLTLSVLGSTITTTSQQIDLNKQSLISLLSALYQTEHQSIVEDFVRYKTFSDIWDAVDTIRQVQKGIVMKSDTLGALKTDLVHKKTATQDQQVELLLLKNKLADQQKILTQTKQEKAALLTQTKNTEATYKKLVADKQAQKTQFEKDLFDFESQLKIAIDPSLLPDARHNTLAWPLDKVIVTQLFGKTNASARLYVSGSHNGVDFGASIGTPVKAALSGVIAGTGNTDAYPGCYSFGKWVMIKHPNGLSTIYGHLSLIKAITGQSVQTGDVIAYSGNTGYSTGPHMHLGVYATQGVRIEKFVNSRGCKQAVLPLADTKAYLDPMVYLPVQ